MKQFFLSLFVSSSVLAMAQKQPYLLVGAYTSGKSKGISVYRFNTQNGTAIFFDSVGTPNPSYLAVSPDKKFVYAVNEVGGKDGGKVSAFRFNEGHLTKLNEQSSMGKDPCYITTDKKNKWVIVGNYSSGTAAVLPVQSNGGLGAAVSVVQHHGRGDHSRQEAPHVHSTVLSPDDRFLYVPDLGIDKVMIYSLNATNGKLESKDTTVKLQAGSGPRHFVFHPNGRWAYLVQELAGTVTVFHVNKGDLEPVQTISVLPADFSKSFTSADIHVSPDGRFLYTSTRDAANLITIFKIDAANGQLTVTGYQSTMGKTPRNFNFDPTGNFLLVANQNSDEIVIFKIDKATGNMTDTGNRIHVGNPVCVKWIVQ